MRGADPGLGVQLLGDVHQILTSRNQDRMHTGTLIEELVKLELRSWSYYGRARVTIRDTDVAHLLDPYELPQADEDRGPQPAWLHPGGRDGGDRPLRP